MEARATNKATMQSYQQQNGMVAGQTTTAKRSLRVIDQLDLAANREDDLEDGPLLLNIGNGFTAEQSDYPHELLDSLDPRQIPSTSGYSGVTAVPTLAQQTESCNPRYAETTALSGSSYGQSFSVPTDETSSVHHDTTPTRQRHIVGLDDYLLSDLGTFTERDPDNHLSTDLDIPALELFATEPSSRDNPSVVLPWRVEFSWVSGKLVYGSDPVTTRPFYNLSQAGSTFTDGITGHLTHTYDTASSDSHVHQDCIEYSQTAGAGFVRMTKGTMTDAMEKALHQGVIDEMWYDFQERVIRIVDNHFWRTHASHSSSKDAGTSDQSNGRSRSGNSSKQHRITKSSGPRRKQQRSGQRDRSEDESSEDGNQRLPASYKSRLHKHQRQAVACPFFKNDPHHFRDCWSIGYRRISSLKKHLRDVHHDYHCPRCLQTLTNEAEALHSSCVVGFQKKVLFLSREAMEQIKIKATKDGQGQYETRISRQWIHLYRVIFPNAGHPFPDPFVEPPEEITARKFTRYLMGHASTLWSLVCPILPELPIVYRKEAEIRFAETLQTWISHTGQHYMEQCRYNGCVPDISSSCDVCLAQRTEDISNSPSICIRQILQTTSARPTAHYQVPDSRPQNLHNFGSGQLGSTHHGIDLGPNVPANTFAAGGCFDNIPLMHNNSAEQDCHSEAGMTGDIDLFHDCITAQHDSQFPSNMNVFSNEFDEPWYAGASRLLEADTAQGFDPSVDARYDPDLLDAGFDQFFN